MDVKSQRLTLKEFSLINFSWVGGPWRIQSEGVQDFPGQNTKAKATIHKLQDDGSVRLQMTFFEDTAVKAVEQAIQWYNERVFSTPQDLLKSLVARVTDDAELRDVAMWALDNRESLRSALQQLIDMHDYYDHA